MLNTHSANHGTHRGQRADNVADYTAFLLNKANIKSKSEQKVIGANSNKRPGDLRIALPLDAYMYVDHTFIAPDAPSKSVPENPPLGMFARQREQAKLDKYAPLLAEEPPALFNADNSFKTDAQVKTLFENAPILKGDGYQRFWPAATEIFGTHGPCFRALMNLIAQKLYENGIGTPKSNLNRMRRNYSRLLYTNVGMAIRDVVKNSSLAPVILPR